MTSLLKGRATSDQIAATLAMVLALSATTSGAAALIMGLVRQGRLARFVPYSVSGGSTDSSPRRRRARITLPPA